MEGKTDSQYDDDMDYDLDSIGVPSIFEGAIKSENTPDLTICRKWYQVR